MKWDRRGSCRGQGTGGHQCGHVKFALEHQIKCCLECCRAGRSGNITDGATGECALHVARIIRCGEDHDGKPRARQAKCGDPCETCSRIVVIAEEQIDQCDIESGIGGDDRKRLIKVGCVEDPGAETERLDEMRYHAFPNDVMIVDKQELNGNGAISLPLLWVPITATSAMVGDSGDEVEVLRL